MIAPAAVRTDQPHLTALYMAAVAAAHHNPLIRLFYQRLRSAGKPAMVALVAWMRKLLTILNAMIRHPTPWSQPICLTEPVQIGNLAIRYMNNTSVVMNR